MDMVTCEQSLALVLGSKMLAVGMDCGFVSIRVIGMQPKGIVCVDQGKVTSIQAWGRSRHRR